MPELVISLTSYPARINTVHLAIETILNQTLKADKVILWLANEEFPNKENDLPDKLLALKSRGLEIDWCENLKSYKKLIPTLRKYPDSIIITADDDLLYESNRVELLVNAYKKGKNNLYCHRITRICFDKNQKITNLSRSLYENGNNYFSPLIRKSSAFNKLSGGAMTLYPPRCFDDEIFNVDLFMSLAPTSDDIWFYLQALRRGFKVRVVENNWLTLNYIDGTQSIGLCHINDTNNNEIFNIHLNRVYEYYPELRQIFLEDAKENKKIITFCKISKLLQKIFSVEKDSRGTHTLIVICGIRMKIRCNGAIGGKTRS